MTHKKKAGLQEIMHYLDIRQIYAIVVWFLSVLDWKKYFYWYGYQEINDTERCLYSPLCQWVHQFDNSSVPSQRNNRGCRAITTAKKLDRQTQSLQISIKLTSNWWYFHFIIVPICCHTVHQCQDTWNSHIFRTVSTYYSQFIYCVVDMDEYSISEMN